MDLLQPTTTSIDADELTQDASTSAYDSVVSVPASTPTDDNALMVRYRNGDTRAFETLYTRHKGALHRYLQRICRNREAVNDLFQETWSKLVTSRARYEPRAQFTTFLFHIAHNCAVDYFRRAERQHMGRTEDVDELQDRLPSSDTDRPDSRASEAELQAAFQLALAQLPEEQRNVFVLREETGMSLEEIGQVTGVTMETAKSRLRYALAKLRTALKQYEPRELSRELSHEWTIVSNAIDDKELDEYLSGGTQYSQRYRSISADEVPAELDRLVLAQASTNNVASIEGAVEKRSLRSKSLSFWMRVSAPVTLAASVVLAVSLVIDNGARYESAPPRINAPMEDTAIPASPNVSEPEAVAANSAVEQFKLESAPEKTADKASRDRRSASQPTSDSLSETVAAAAVAAQSAKEIEKKRESRAVAAGAPAPASAPASVAADQRATTELDSVIVTGTFHRSSPQDSAIPVEVISAQEMARARADSTAGPRDTIRLSRSEKQKPRNEQLSKELREADPAAWLTYIRELRSTDKSREADGEWQRFVKAYPAYSVDEGDNARPKQ